MQKKELKELVEIVNEYHKKYDIVLTGDFNMDEDKEYFRDFIEELNKNEITKIKIEGYTWRSKRGKQKVLDYIFASDKSRVTSFGIIPSNNLSDHEIIYLDLDI